ncbi:hypothetical protein S7711_03080 [Stachybotrys chartarum IBT 7711]|uniref:N-acetylgalactosaminide beta-1,3-galactosyltransferase n=1 Tax=Stachybotrys chartarum (strain CBS 109288 / IBT 7711) TaxID=1280523 RepID=A0A084B893_STACB|nr:hypothetical protein S7711_03080 [Stachybotrys chartarum IBT 7711]
MDTSAHDIPPAFRRAVDRAPALCTRPASVMHPTTSTDRVPWASMLILNKRFTRIVTAGIVFVTLFYFLRDKHVEIALEYNHVFHLDASTVQDVCAEFAKDDLLQLIQPVLKMGHGERRDKIEAQLDSVCACFAEDELLIFSDLAETVRGRTVVDILADLPRGYFNATMNPDIKNYIMQKEMQVEGTLDVDVEATKRINGWILDKYKFLPMVQRAWEAKPDRPFYFFLETDTYVFWDNAVRFLTTLDPDKPLYMGSPSPGRHDEEQDIKTWFANGGPGFVLSRGAVKALLDRKEADGKLEPPLVEKWLPLLSMECCGDSVVGWTLWNISVPLQGYWPLFNPHPLHGIPFSDPYWCQPVVTLHKTTPDDVKRLWLWESEQKRFKLNRPILYSDVWNFHHPVQQSIRRNWDNGEWDNFRPPVEANIDSPESCEDFCRSEASCMQWLWRGLDEKQCILMRSARYGQPRRPEPMPEEEGGETPLGTRLKRMTDFTSGWVQERIVQWREEHVCREVQWVEPSIERIF